MFMGRAHIPVELPGGLHRVGLEVFGGVVPPLFEEDDIDPMMDHAANSYFRHFRLYRINLSARVQLELEQCAPGFVRVPRAQPGLDEAIEVTGEVDELELSREELQIVEKEVRRRMEPTLAGFRKQEKAYRNIIDRLGAGSTEGEAGGKK